MLYMFLAEGFEETEAIGALDVILRAGLKIKTVSLDKKTVYGSHGIGVVSDILLDEIRQDEMDGVILPGGLPGTTNLKNNSLVEKTICFCNENGLLLAAICAAPMVFGELGILKGKRATCYPGFEGHLKGATLSEDGVVRDGNIITAKGAGVSMKFGAEIVNYFKPEQGEIILKQIQHG